MQNQKKIEELIEEITSYFKDERKVADHTIFSYRTYWRKFERYLLSQNIDFVDPEICRNFIHHSLGDKPITHLTANEKMLLRI